VNAIILRVFLIVFGFLVVISLWGFYSSIRPPKILSSLTPRDLKMGYENASFRTADGLTLRGWYIPTARRTEKTLILLHGYPADKGDILPALAFLHEDFNLLLFDFRYLGKSEAAIPQPELRRSKISSRLLFSRAEGKGWRVGIFHGWGRGFDGGESPGSVRSSQNQVTPASRKWLSSF
jgi:pimeloyl-ACP methyl ester carboxylesterase